MNPEPVASEPTTTYPHPLEESGYETLLDQVHRAAAGEGAVYTTNAAELWDAFLEGLPPDRRQHYRCHACRRFVQRFGGLVEIDADGTTRSAIWHSRTTAPPFFAEAIDRMRWMVERARVTGVFLTNQFIWGTPKNRGANSPTGVWHHMHVVVPSARLFQSTPLLSAEQAMAEKVQDYLMLSRGLAEFPIETVRQAHTLLSVGGFYRSEKCIGIARWLLDLHEARAATEHKTKRENLVWRAVATAPAGYGHIRSSMIGTVLEDLLAGKAVADVKGAFAAKMDPLIYQRPQAAPTAGQLDAAEAVIAKLASAGSLARRFARLDEVAAHAIWTPKPKGPPAAPGRVFGHLRASAVAAAIMEVPMQVMTWDKFRRTVLEGAESLECLTPQVGAYFAFVTAEDPVAPPILQWDHPEARNPVSWYVYAKGSRADQWEIVPNRYVPVTAVTLQPSGWGALAHGHHGESAFFLLQGARDTGNAHLSLFPEFMRSEYHPIRAVIEAYGRSKAVGGLEGASACGLRLQQQGGELVVRATVKGARAVYRLDRWD